MSKQFMRKHPTWVKHKGDRKSENYKMRKYIRENPLKKTTKFDKKKKMEEERLKRQKEIEREREEMEQEEEEEEEEETKDVLSDGDDFVGGAEDEENEEEEGVDNEDDDEDEDEDEEERRKIDIKSLPKRVQQKIRYEERKNKRLAEKKKPKKGKVFMDVNIYILESEKFLIYFIIFIERIYAQVDWGDWGEAGI